MAEMVAPVRCHHCHTLVDLAPLGEQHFRYGAMPNTLTGLPDHNTVEWQCSECGKWNTEEDKE